MLLNKEVEVVLRGKNVKYYENLGYKIPRRKDKWGNVTVPEGTKIIVRVEDLSKGSTVKVDVKCDCPNCKNNIIKKVAWADYLKYVHEDGKYYCRNCAKKLYGGENARKSRLKNSASFGYWLIKNLSLKEAVSIILRWDDKLNDCDIRNVSYSSQGFNKKGYWFKCNRNLHESELKNLSTFVAGNRESINCKRCNSFEQWCIDNNKQDILNRWDYELNGKLPSEVNYGSSKEKYYFKCPRGLHPSELKSINHFTNNKTNMECDACNSFEQWCYDNLSKEDANKILSRWDYKLNNCSPNEIRYGASNKKYWFKCPKGIYPSELKSINGFTSGSEGSMYCNECNSFGYWCENHGKLDILKRWSSKNKCSPYEVNAGTHKKYWFNCPRGIHKPELKIIVNFTIGHEGVMNCSSCNSIGQYIVDTYGENGLQDYWDYEKNNELGLYPFEVTKACQTKVWIKCQEKDYHKSYDVSCNNFTNRGSRCPYCINKNGKIHKFDSLGWLHPQVFDIWSKKNKKSPYEYAPKSEEKVYWKCSDGKHQDYKRGIDISNKAEFRCPECIQERDESMIQEKTRLYLESLGYNVLHENKCTLKPKNIIQPPNNINKKRGKGILRYDNEIILPNNKHLFIEVMGEQHEKICYWHEKSANKYNTTPEQELEYQIAKDKYKEQYVHDQGNNYYYLAVWYYDFDKQDTYKKLMDNKVSEILHKEGENKWLIH